MVPRPHLPVVRILPASVPPLLPTRNWIESEVPAPEVDFKTRAEETPLPPIIVGEVSDPVRLPLPVTVRALEGVAPPTPTFPFLSIMNDVAVLDPTTKAALPASELIES